MKYRIRLHISVESRENPDTWNSDTNVFVETDALGHDILARVAGAVEAAVGNEVLRSKEAVEDPDWCPRYFVPAGKMPVRIAKQEGDTDE